MKNRENIGKRSEPCGGLGVVSFREFIPSSAAIGTLRSNDVMTATKRSRKK